MKLYSENDYDLAADAFARHEILTFPTDTVYGAGVLFGSLEDLEKLKQIKHRPETKPIPVMTCSKDMIKEICLTGPREEKIIDSLLPGALTLILPLRPEIDRRLFNGNETAAIRIPDAPFILKTIETLNQPLFVTSANVSGEPAALSLEEAVSALPLADGAVAGKCHALKASTIVDCTKDELVILRQGPIALETIQTVIGH